MANDETVTRFYVQLEDLANTTIPHAVDALADDRDALLRMLVLHRSLLSAMRDADTLIEAAVLRHDFEFKGETVDGVGFVRVYKKGKRTRYDNEMVVSRLAAAMSDHVALPDEETGAYPPIPVIVERVVENMADLVGARTQSFSSWRKTKAALLGVDVDQYASSEGGALAVSIE